MRLVKEKEQHEQRQQQQQQQRQHHDAKNRVRRKGQRRRAEGRHVTRERRIRLVKGGERERDLPRKNEAETGSEASQRRQDRRRQPAITSWNVWERVGLDPKGPATTKFPFYPPTSPLFHPFYVNDHSVRPLPCTE